MRKKVQTLSSLESPLSSLGPDAFDKLSFIMTFLTILGVTEIFYSFRFVLEGKTGREKPESSRLKFLWKFSSNNFTLSDAEYNTCEPLNRRGIADLPLLEHYSQCAKSPECQVSGKR